MDPNTNLKRQLEIVGEINLVRDGNSDQPLYPELADLGMELAELVGELDEWRRKGGFDPYGTHSRLVRSLQQELIQAARNIEPNNDRLVEAGDPTETFTSLLEARRVLRIGIPEQES